MTFNWFWLNYQESINVDIFGEFWGENWQHHLVKNKTCLTWLICKNSNPQILEFFYICFMLNNSWNSCLTPDFFAKNLRRLFLHPKKSGSCRSLHVMNPTNLHTKRPSTSHGKGASGDMPAISHAKKRWTNRSWNVVFLFVFFWLRHPEL